MPSGNRSDSSAKRDLSRAALRTAARHLSSQFGPLYDRRNQTKMAALQSLHRATREKRIASINARLQGMTLEKLAAGQNIRQAGLTNLRRHGVRTAHDVLGCTPEDLTAAPGIGSDGATKLLERARTLSAPRHEDLMLSKPFDLWSGAEYAVARAVRFWNELVKLLDSNASKSLERLAGGSRRIVHDTAWHRWLFTGGHRRAQLRELLYALEPEASTFRSSGEFSSFSGKLQDLAHLEHHQGVTVDRTYWSRNSIDLLSSLEQFYVQGDNSEVRDVVSRRALDVDDDLVAQMADLRLNTTLLARRLRPYQEEGTRFCICVGSGLLGDDMGLGRPPKHLPRSLISRPTTQTTAMWLCVLRRSFWGGKTRLRPHVLASDFGCSEGKQNERAT